MAKSYQKDSPENLENGECIGCLNIRNMEFPFTYVSEGDWENPKTIHTIGAAIDSEGCGLTQDRSKDELYYLQIFFCPVCGKELTY